MEQHKRRVTFYIDGFNFYFGLKRSKRTDIAWRQFYWIDMVNPSQKQTSVDGKEYEEIPNGNYAGNGI